MKPKHAQSILQTLGRNPIHPFPARMAPGIALEALDQSQKPLRVLDPMMGSGTVLAVAQENGHWAVGVDLDPLAVLLSRVWTQSLNQEVLRQRAVQVLKRAMANFSQIRTGDAYPRNSDEETQSFIRYWFDPYARRQLTSLSNTIRRVRNANEREALWCAFSRLIITKSAGASLAMDLSHSRPHREFSTAPVKPFNKFLSSVETVIQNCPKRGSKLQRPAAKVRIGDARRLRIRSNSIDLVLTSPPYLNAIDYMRCSKFSLVWMGYTVSEIRHIRGESIGSESSSEKAKAPWICDIVKDLKMKPKLPRRDGDILSRYIWDMNKALSEVSRVLRNGGRAVYVVGDSKLKGTFVRNSSIIAAVAKANGLTLQSRRARRLPANRRYLPPPRVGKSLVHWIHVCARKS